MVALIAAHCSLFSWLAPALGQTEVKKTQPANALPTAEAEATVSAISLSTDGTTSRLTIVLSRTVDARAYYLPNPDRLVIDLPDVAFRLDRAWVAQRGGAIVDLRYGLLAPGKARVVADATQPLRVIRSQTATTPAGAVLTIDLEVTDYLAALLGPTEGNRGTPPQPPTASRSPLPTSSDPRPIGPDPRQANSRPVILIDPGHGGIDPGAVGLGGLLEKDLVLAVAKLVRSSLLARGRYDVRMTREADVFVSLDQRVLRAGQIGAALFISIHADAVGDPGLAGSARGATVYIRSEKASSRDAQRQAERENAADSRAGLPIAQAAADPDVKGILADLMRRETLNFSNQIQRSLIRSLGRTVTMAKDPARSAAFKVLDNGQTPSVLIELGYVSNEAELREMQSPEWQKRVAAAIAAAADQYFERRQRP